MFEVLLHWNKLKGTTYFLSIFHICVTLIKPCVCAVAYVHTKTPHQISSFNNLENIGSLWPKESSACISVVTGLVNRIQKSLLVSSTVKFQTCHYSSLVLLWYWTFPTIKNVQCIKIKAKKKNKEKRVNTMYKKVEANLGYSLPLGSIAIPDYSSVPAPLVSQKHWALHTRDPSSRWGSLARHNKVKVDQSWLSASSHW